MCNRNQPDHRGRGGHMRQPYGGHFPSRECDSNERQLREGGFHRGHYGRRDQFQPKDNYNRVHYAGVREQSGHDGPEPKYSRQTNDRQPHH